MKTLLLKLLVVSIAITSQIVTAADLTPDLIKCSNLKNDIKRLQCFDEYIVKSSTKKQTMLTNKSSTIKANQPITSKTENKEELISSFGQAHKYSKKEREFDEMKSTIVSATKNLHKKWKIELENGQVWIEKGGDKRAKFSAGDSVIITRGIMNSFQLKKVGSKRRIRVQRSL